MGGGGGGFCFLKPRNRSQTFRLNSAKHDSKYYCIKYHKFCFKICNMRLKKIQTSCGSPPPPPPPQSTSAKTWCLHFKAKFVKICFIRMCHYSKNIFIISMYFWPKWKKIVLWLFTPDSLTTCLFTVEVMELNQYEKHF